MVEYIFDEKFEKEIEIKEKLRREAELKIINASTTDAEMRKNLKGFDEKYPQILSNGKRYYTRWIDYERDTGKKAEVPEIYINKIKEFIGDDFLKEEPRIYPKYMYFDGKEMRIIKIYLSYTYIETKYGLFGDEGRGVSFTKESFGTKSGDNIFYLTNNKFIKANKDK